MNHRAPRTHLSHNRLLNERGSHGVQLRAARTKEGDERRFSAVTYLTIAAAMGGGGLLSCSLSHSGCVTQAGWMPLSTASCSDEEAYARMRTSAHFMNI